MTFLTYHIIRLNISIVSKGKAGIFIANISKEKERDAPAQQKLKKPPCHPQFSGKFKLHNKFMRKRNG